MLACFRCPRELAANASALSGLQGNNNLLDEWAPDSKAAGMFSEDLALDPLVTQI
jgi:hypothetical protein